MSQELSITTESPFQPNCESLNPRMAFMMAMKKLNTAGKRLYDSLEIKKLLNMAGFSQNGRKRILRLSGEEISVLCTSCPSDDELWSFYESELQALLSKMDQERNVDSSFGRPHVTAELSKTVCILARLRCIEENGYHFVQATRMRDFILYDGWYKLLDQFLEIGEPVNKLSSALILTQSAIQLIELYRDELIKPPRFRTRLNFDEFDLHLIETDDFSWMDDGGKSYLAAIRDIPLTTQYDDLPHFYSVLDWFVATKPVLDNNQIKQGWNCLEKLSEEWHLHQDSYGLYEEYIDEYPSWTCFVSDRPEEWLSAIQPNQIYKFIPLITPHQLLEESILMHHCVVTYLDDCISGNVRIFSVLASSNNERIATLELTNRTGLWKVAQLKGKHNQELIQRIYDSTDPLAIILDVLVQWYNDVTGANNEISI